MVNWKQHPLLTHGGNMQAVEYQAIAQVLEKRAPCNLLVFGAGYDGELWEAINQDGQTVFLEDDPQWAAVGGANTVLIDYQTHLSEWETLLAEKNVGALEMHLPSQVLSTKWDVILVDGPRGYQPEHPGRMQSIYTAAQLARRSQNVDVLVHDVERPVEYVYSEIFLLRENLISETHWLWHFRIKGLGQTTAVQAEDALIAQRWESWRELHRQYLKQQADNNEELLRNLRQQNRNQVQKITYIEKELAQLRSPAMPKIAKSPVTILLIADQPKWAIDHKARNLQRVLGADFNIVLKYQTEVTKVDLDQADLIQIFFWMQIKHIEATGIVLDEYLDKLLLGVCGQVEIEGARRESALAWLRKARAVFTINLSLFKELQTEIDTPLFYTPNGVDTSLFYPSSKPKELATLRVGWAGSLDNHTPVQRGFYNLIVPAVNSVANTELVAAIRSERWRSLEEMRDFYQSLDVYLCASRNEGGPNPCLEAAACGVPVITTRVGCMPEFIVPDVNGLFVEQNVADIAAKLTWFRDNPAVWQSMSSASRERAQAWDWQHLKENFRTMYQAVLSDTVRSWPAQAHLIPALKQKVQKLENEIARLSHLTTHQKNAIDKLEGQLTEVQHIADVASREVESLHNAKFYKAASLFWKWRKRVFGR